MSRLHSFSDSDDVLSGRREPVHPSLGNVRDNPPPKPKCPECGSTDITERTDPAGGGRIMRSWRCDDCEYLIDVSLDR